MFNKTSRINNIDNGIVFYEQDVLIDDIIYNSDIKIDCNFSYYNSGFGIIIFNEDNILKDNIEYYLIRVGYKEASIEQIVENRHNILMRSPIIMTPPILKTNITCSKTGKKLVLKSDLFYFDYTLPKNINNFKIGIYSNANNIIHNLSINSKTPKQWIINMQNTNGGSISFNKNEFKIIDCFNGDAEIEQNNILLKEKGIYKLNYNKNNDNNIKAIVSLTKDTRYLDKDRNILNKDGTFYVEKDTNINLKFKGNYGNISNIIISNILNDIYKPTYCKQYNSHSYIELLLDDVLIFNFSFTIYSTSDKDYYIFDDKIQKIKLLDLNIIPTERYNLRYEKNKSKIIISNKNNIIVKQLIINNSCNLLTIFKNVDAKITDFYIIRNNGEKIYITNNIEKKILPSMLTSPIIVCNMNNEPFDLSSSYRINKKTNKFIFTNIEREFFTSNQYLKLAHFPKQKNSYIKIYGIKTLNEMNVKKILTITDSVIDDISELTKDFDVINDKIKHINYNNKEIYLYDYDQYQYIVVDYAKENSYCINYNQENYDIDISTSNSKYKILYDSEEEIIDNKKVQNINGYKKTNLIAEKDKYLILKGSDDYENLSFRS